MLVPGIEAASHIPMRHSKVYSRNSTHPLIVPTTIILEPLCARRRFALQMRVRVRVYAFRTFNARNTAHCAPRLADGRPAQVFCSLLTTNNLAQACKISFSKLRLSASCSWLPLVVRTRYKFRANVKQWYVSSYTKAVSMNLWWLLCAG